MNKNSIYKGVLFCLLLVMLCSCTERKQEKLVSLPHSFVFDEAKDSIWDFPSMIDVTDVVPLETTEEGYLYKINKIEEYAGALYLLDKRAGGVFVFSLDGKFKHRIGAKGIGPGQYSNVRDFTIDRKNNRIIILSNTDVSQVYVYDLEGTFINRQEISRSMLWNIESLPTGGFVCSSNHLTYTEGDNAFLLFLFDEDFCVQKKQEPVFSQQILSPMFVSRPFQVTETGAYYLDNFTGDIYTIDSTAIEKYAAVKFENPMPMEFFVSTQLFMKHQRDYDYIMEFALLDDRMLVAYVCSGNYHVAVVSLEDYGISKARFSGTLPPMFAGEDKTMLSSFNVLEYSSVFSTDRFTEDDNMVIVRYRWR